VGADPRAAVVIGDGLVTDIAAAHAIGARSVLMLTGVSSREQVDALPVDRRPNAVVADAAELAVALRELGRQG
jgi:ribonucleotide monophosphatase NagD (HAD superfamily)